MSKKSINETSKLKLLISQTNALIQTVNDILKNQDTAITGRYSSYKDMARIYNDLVYESKKSFKVETMFYSFNLELIPEPDDSTWPFQKRILENVLVNSRLLYSILQATVDFVDDEFDNLTNFLLTHLRSAIFQVPSKEIEIQNAIETLLLGRGLNKGIDYDRESGKFEFSGKEYIPDFIITKLNLCIEVKLLRPGKKSRIIEEISADITAYKKQYQNQLFVIYDLGVIQNEIEFKRDIESNDGVKIIIIKH